MRFTASAGDTIPYLVLALVAAAAVSFVLTPLIRRVAVRHGAIDRPNRRRVNKLPVPRGGGVAVAIAFVGVSLGLLGLNTVAPFVAVPSSVQLSDLVGLFLGGILATAFGVVDDALDLRARWQFAGQLGLALFAIALGFVVDFVANPFGSGSLRLGGAI